MRAHTHTRTHTHTVDVQSHIVPCSQVDLRGEAERQLESKRNRRGGQQPDMSLHRPALLLLASAPDEGEGPSVSGSSWQQLVACLSDEEQTEVHKAKSSRV